MPDSAAEDAPHRRATQSLRDQEHYAAALAGVDLVVNCLAVDPGTIVSMRRRPQRGHLGSEDRLSRSGSAV